MPLYEYECSGCGERFEVIQKFSDKPVKTCRKCGGKVERLISSAAIQFKGTGWYVTDYAKKGSPSDGSESGSKESSKSGSPAAAESSGKKEGGKPSPQKKNS